MYLIAVNVLLLSEVQRGTDFHASKMSCLAPRQVSIFPSPSTSKTTSSTDFGPQGSSATPTKAAILFNANLAISPLYAKNCMPSLKITATEIPQELSLAKEQPLTTSQPPTVKPL